MNAQCSSTYNEVITKGSLYAQCTSIHVKYEYPVRQHPWSEWKPSALTLMRRKHCLMYHRLREERMPSAKNQTLYGD